MSRQTQIRSDAKTDRELVAKMYNAGTKLEVIADHFGVSRQRIYQIAVQSLGLPKRGGHGGRVGAK